MLLYDFKFAPGPRRVRMFAAEKNIPLTLRQVDLRENEQFHPEFMAINPDCTVPVLVPDAGAAICGVMPICGYLEEITPEPPLIGATPSQRAHVAMWNMRMEEGYAAVVEMLRNSHPYFKERGLPGAAPVPQIAALAERGAERCKRFYTRINERLADNLFIAGDQFSIADITAVCSLGFAARFKHELPGGLPHVQRWYREVAARPSAEA